MFCALNSMLRRQRRRLVVFAVMLGLAGTVVVAHSAMGQDHMGDALVVCLAVAETAVVAVGVALALGTWMRRPLWLLPEPAAPELPFAPLRVDIRARGGPPLLQVFRL